MSTQLGIMFADIADSTPLYEALGDEKAEHAISFALDQMGGISEEYGGNKVKTIGDEIMCRFPDVDSLVHAACDIQREFADRDLGDGHHLKVRIGLYFGNVIVKNQDVFGDIVNVAARMVRLAQPGQIITTSQTAEKISDASILTRMRGSVLVKGKQNKFKIQEILWEAEDSELTQFISANDEASNNQNWVLRLQYQGRSMELSADLPQISLGRGKQCDLLIESKTASRKHAMLVHRGCKMLLVEQSTNGTFVTSKNGTEVFVHMEEYPLTGVGVISLGCRASAGKDYLIQYNYQS